MCYLPFLWNCLWNLLAISWVKIVFFKLDHHNMLLLYKKEQHEQQCSSKILFFSSTEESQSHRFGASWEVNYTFIKFLGWMCSLESRLNFRVLTCFWWDHRQTLPSPYVRQEAVSCVSMVPWIISALMHMHSSRFMRCRKNWAGGLATPTPLTRRKTSISFRCTQKSSTFLLFSGHFMLGLKQWLTDLSNCF